MHVWQKWQRFGLKAKVATKPQTAGCPWLWSLDANHRQKRTKRMRRCCLSVTVCFLVPWGTATPFKSYSDKSILNYKGSRVFPLLEYQMVWQRCRLDLNSRPGGSTIDAASFDILGDTNTCGDSSGLERAVKEKENRWLGVKFLEKIKRYRKAVINQRYKRSWPA